MDTALFVLVGRGFAIGVVVSVIVAAVAGDADRAAQKQQEASMFVLEIMAAFLVGYFILGPLLFFGAWWLLDRILR